MLNSEVKNRNLSSPAHFSRLLALHKPPWCHHKLSKHPSKVPFFSGNNDQSYVIGEQFCRDHMLCRRKEDASARLWGLSERPNAEKQCVCNLATKPHSRGCARISPRLRVALQGSGDLFSPAVSSPSFSCPASSSSSLLVVFGFLYFWADFLWPIILLLVLFLWLRLPPWGMLLSHWSPKVLGLLQV